MLVKTKHREEQGRRRAEEPRPRAWSRLSDAAGEVSMPQRAVARWCYWPRGAVVGVGVVEGASGGRASERRARRWLSEREEKLDQAGGQAGSVISRDPGRRGVAAVITDCCSVSAGQRHSPTLISC